MVRTKEVPVNEMVMKDVNALFKRKPTAEEVTAFLENRKNRPYSAALQRIVRLLANIRDIPID